MTISLYSASVGYYLQLVEGLQNVLEKGAVFAKQNDLDVNTFVNQGLHDSMLPLLFQVNCVELHSIGAIEALKTGSFAPPNRIEKRDYAQLQAVLVETQSRLEALSEESVNQYAGKTVRFKFDEYDLPFTAENFILSFSLPNLNFHNTTAYGILRHLGVPLGKNDYIGNMRAIEST